MPNAANASAKKQKKETPKEIQPWKNNLERLLMA
jgi:hypothetical protein